MLRVVLHQKALYPALGELAKNYREEKSEETVLIAEAAVHVNAYPDQDVRTPFERLLLGKYDENALRPYRGANCVEMLCKQGYTEEQALDEAARCLHCKNHPCVDGCPVNAVHGWR